MTNISAEVLQIGAEKRNGAVAGRKGSVDSLKGRMRGPRKNTEEDFVLHTAPASEAGVRHEAAPVCLYMAALPPLDV